MRLTRKYEAEAAHQLSAGVPDGHPCRRLHGHRYEIWVSIIGDVHPETGYVYFLDLDDHSGLNSWNEAQSADWNEEVVAGKDFGEEIGVVVIDGHELYVWEYAPEMAR